MNEIIEIKNPRQIPNYSEMIEDMRSIIVKTEGDARMMVIEGYHELGTTLIKYKLNKPEFLSQVSQDLKKSKRTIYRVLQFVEMFPDLRDLPEGVDISWHKICNKYLVGKSEENETTFTVPRDELIAYIYENAEFLADTVTYNSNGLTLRVGKDSILKFVEERQ